MPSLDDMELVRKYVEHGSDAAFEAILSRHVNLVYSTALRQVREPVLAAEVTQTTFIILARKAHTLGSGTILSGWLYRTAQFAATRALRTAARRRDREREAAEMQSNPSDHVWERLAPVLDHAMAQLSASDRNAIVLRYFENKSSRDVGAVLGINEVAAQKRVARAMEKLRGLCTKRGVVLPAVAMVTLISANAVKAAPVGVVSTTAALKGIGVSTSTFALVKGTLHVISWVKYRIAAYTSLGLAIVVATTLVAGQSEWFQPRRQNRSLSSWLTQLDDGQRNYVLILPWQPWQNQLHYTPEQAQAAEVVRSMGAPALPFLMSGLKTDDSALNRLWGKLGTPPDAARYQAMLGLDALGPECRPLIPQLTKLLRTGRAPKEAAAVLASIGPPGWEVLTTNILSTNEDVASCSIWALGMHKAAVNGTVEAMEYGFANREEGGNTALTGWAMAEIGQDREQVVALLTKGLKFHRTDTKWGCAVALGRLGRDAESAVPDLVALLPDKDPVIHHDAAQALEQIDPPVAARYGVTGALATEHIPKTMALP